MELEAVTINSQDLVLSLFESSPDYFLRVDGCLPSLETVHDAILSQPQKLDPHYKKEFLISLVFVAILGSVSAFFFI